MTYKSMYGDKTYGGKLDEPVTDIQKQNVDPDSIYYGSLRNNEIDYQIVMNNRSRLKSKLNRKIRQSREVKNLSHLGSYSDTSLKASPEGNGRRSRRLVNNDEIRFTADMMFDRGKMTNLWTKWFAEYMVPGDEEPARLTGPLANFFQEWLEIPSDGIIEGMLMEDDNNGEKWEEKRDVLFLQALRGLEDLKMYLDDKNILANYAIGVYALYDIFVTRKSANGKSILDAMYERGEIAQNEYDYIMHKQNGIELKYGVGNLFKLIDTQAMILQGLTQKLIFSTKYDDAIIDIGELAAQTVEIIGSSDDKALAEQRMINAWKNSGLLPDGVNLENHRKAKGQATLNVAASMVFDTDPAATVNTTLSPADQAVQWKSVDVTRNLEQVAQNKNFAENNFVRPTVNPNAAYERVQYIEEPVVDVLQSSPMVKNMRVVSENNSQVNDTAPTGSMSGSKIRRFDNNIVLAETKLGEYTQFEPIGNTQQNNVTVQNNTQSIYNQPGFVQLGQTPGNTQNVQNTQVVNQTAQSNQNVYYDNNGNSVGSPYYHKPATNEEWIRFFTAKENGVRDGENVYYTLDEAIFVNGHYVYDKTGKQIFISHSKEIGPKGRVYYKKYSYSLVNPAQAGNASMQGNINTSYNQNSGYNQNVGYNQNTGYNQNAGYNQGVQNTQYTNQNVNQSFVSMQPTGNVQQNQTRVFNNQPSGYHSNVQYTQQNVQNVPQEQIFIDANGNRYVMVNQNQNVQTANAGHATVNDVAALFGLPQNVSSGTGTATSVRNPRDTWMGDGINFR